MACQLMIMDFFLNTRIIWDIIIFILYTIISTSPGAASVVARLLDYCEHESRIMGTVAGDDSILVIPKQKDEIELVFDEVKKLIWNE